MSHKCELKGLCNQNGVFGQIQQLISDGRRLDACVWVCSDEKQPVIMDLRMTSLTCYLMGWEPPET